MVNSRDLGAQSTLSALTRLWMLTLEPERRKNRPIAARNESSEGKSSPQRSSCLLLQMFSVETNSFLPNQQSDRRDLARQGKPRHRWLHSAGNAGRVKFLKRSGGGRRSRSRSLEDIFQIVIMIFVESANSQLKTPLKAALPLHMTFVAWASRFPLTLVAAQEQILAPFGIDLGCWACWQASEAS